MKKPLARVLLVLLAVLMVTASCSSDDDGSIEVQDARYRLSRSDLGAGYLSVTNTTGEDVTLESASADGVGRIELHESSMGDDGAMSMQERPGGFLIPDGETVTLQPGGLHLMIFDPIGTDDLTIELDFGVETIEVLAAYDAEASAAAMSDSSMGDMGDMDHGDDESMGDMAGDDDESMADMAGDDDESMDDMAGDDS